jgi:hypothetical protein
MCTGTHDFIPVPNTARLRAIYTLYGQKCMNVFYFERGVPFDSEALSDTLTAFIDAYTDTIKPFVPSDVTLQTVDITALDDEAGLQEAASPAVVGIGAGDAAPGNVTIAIKFSSGLTGRSQRGRMFHVGLKLGDLVGDQVDSAVAEAIRAAWADVLTTTAGEVDSEHVVVSYCHDGEWRTTGQTTPVTAYLLTDNNVDSMRNRLAGRGV